MSTLKDLLFRYTTDASRFVVIDNMLVHYRDEGEGPVLLLLHGAFSSLHTYNSWTKLLKKDFRIIRLDLMGFGLTGPNDSDDYSMNNHIRVLKTFLNILKIERCSIVGNSLGGWLAWEFTCKYPKRIEKLVLIDAAGFLEEQNIPLPFKLARAPIFGRVIRYVVRRSVLEQFVRQVYYDASKVNEQLINRYYDLFTRNGNTNAFLKLANTQAKDNTSQLANIYQPTLIMWGQEDMWIPVNNAYRFNHMIPNSFLKIYKKIGHIPMEEIPERSVEDLCRFLKNEPPYTPNMLTMPEETPDDQTP